MLQVLVLLVLGAVIGGVAVMLFSLPLPLVRFPVFEPTLPFFRQLIAAATGLFVLLMLALAA